MGFIPQEYFDFKSPEGQQTFKHILDTENHLTSCFDSCDDIETQVNNWLKKFNDICGRSFKKTRINGKVKLTDLSRLQKLRTELVHRQKLSPDDPKVKEELEKVIEEITIKVAEQNRNKIMDNFKHLDQSEGETFSNGIWNIKKKIMPKNKASLPAAKIDVHGNLVTEPNALKKLYLETFQHRLRNRPSKKDYAEIEKLQEILCEKRLLWTADEKAPDWTEKEVREALKSLKNNKAKDPLGYINELFKTQGEDLVKSLVLMMNKIKRKMKLPGVFHIKNVTSLFKNKGSRSDLKNDRGIFNCTILNSLLQKLLLKRNYNVIDSNLTDSNCGSRKGKNIRNNSFIVNAVINEANRSNKNLNIQIYDYKECFDSLDVTTCLNDLFNVGVTSDHLNLIKECDARSDIAVKTPVGLTQRIQIKNVVAQGETFSPLKCTVTVDSISESASDNIPQHLYLYKNNIPIPPLGMVDDQINLTNCGVDSTVSASHINSMTNIKKLQFGPSKCFKIHIGKNTNVCPDNVIDTWTMKPSTESVTSILELLDEEGDQEVLLSVTNEKYLGDIIMASGSNSLNIQARVQRGLGAVNQICHLMDEMCLGPWHFEAGNVLRGSLLLSTLLSNSESWYNLTPKEIESLEKVDEAFMRKLFSSQVSTPREALYLESGNIPIRFVLMSRRLNFLHYMLNEDEDSLIRSVLNAQIQNPTNGDWITTALEDIKSLEINLSLEEIQRLSKVNFKKMLKENVRIKSFQYLLNIKESHSKTINLEYSALSLQNYLKPFSLLSIKEKSFIFSARCRMVEVRCNFKTGKTDLNCRKCQQEPETQRHLLICPELNQSLSPFNHDYMDLFGKNLENLIAVGKRLRECFKLVITCPNVHSSDLNRAGAATAM